MADSLRPYRGPAKWILAAAANVRASSRLLRRLIVILGLAVATETLGVRIAPMLAAGGVFVAALGFAREELTDFGRAP